MQLIVNSETFVSRDEISRYANSCDGCAFDMDECVMSTGEDERCGEHNIIWVKHKPATPDKQPEELKYTVEQVLHSYGECATCSVSAAMVDRVQDRLKQLEESDYKTYLLLKARFEG